MKVTPHDVFIRSLTRSSVALVRILPRRLREQYGREMAGTIAEAVEARGREAGVLAAARRALDESLNLAGVAARARLGGKRGPLAAAVVTLAIAWSLWPLTREPARGGPRVALVAPSTSLTSGERQSDALKRQQGAASDLDAALALPLAERIPQLIALRHLRFDPSMRARYVEIESTLCSSRDYRLLYEAMLADPRLTDAERIVVIEAAARRIDRSVELADLIVRGGAVRQSSAVHAAYRRAAAAIDLERERARASSALAAHERT